MKIWFEKEIKTEIETEDRKYIEEAGSLCLEEEGLTSPMTDRSSISVSFVSPEEIREINNTYRSVDRVTDVLSFPMFQDVEEIKKALESRDPNQPEQPEISLGDVVICREKIVSQADEYGHSIRRELVYLFVHSVLHLLGYDHIEDEEKKKMRGREDKIMKKLGIDRSFDDMDLYSMAEKASESAYAPYSNFKVGAALLCSDGEIYTGVNVENSSYGGTICAERTALVKAISEGKRSFEAIAVFAKDREAVPCGICLQFMAEFSTEIRIITCHAGEDGKGLVSRSLKEMLPHAFALEEKK